MTSWQPQLRTLSNRSSSGHLTLGISNCPTTPLFSNLGVTIDGPLTMRDHVLRICRMSFYQLRQSLVIRGSLSTETCTAIVHAFVSTRLDCCNSLLPGLSNELINKLQSINT